MHIRIHCELSTSDLNVIATGKTLATVDNAEDAENFTSNVEEIINSRTTDIVLPQDLPLAVLQTYCAEHQLTARCTWSQYQHRLSTEPNYVPDIPKPPHYQAYNDWTDA